MKKREHCNYNYLTVDISDDTETGYKAIIPKFPKILVLADTPEELHEQVEDAIKDAIKDLKKKNLPVPFPDKNPKYNGKILVRIKPELHEQLYLEAQASRLSLNRYIQNKLETA